MGRYAWTARVAAGYRRECSCAPQSIAIDGPQLGHCTRILRLTAKFAGQVIGVSLVALVFGTAPYCIAGEGDTFTPYAFATLMYDDNVFRLSDEQLTRALLGTDERGDVRRSYGMGLQVDWPVSLQRFIVDASFNENHYNRFDFLDYRGYDVSATWKWRVGENFWGDLSHERNKTLTSFSDFRLPIPNLQVLERDRLLGFYRISPMVRLRAAISRLNLENDTQIRRINDREERAWEAGGQMISNAGNTVGLLYRHTIGEYPNRPFQADSIIDDDFDQDEVELTFNWRMTGHSHLNGFVGYIDRTHDQLPERDYNGPSLRLNYEWRVTAKTRFIFNAYQRIGDYQDVDVNYALTKGVAAEVRWSATSKITADARIEYKKRDFLGDPGFILISIPNREDKYLTMNAGISYAVVPDRIRLSLSVYQDHRTSNAPFQDYDALAVFSSVQLFY